MRRLVGGHAEPIAVSLALIPAGIVERLAHVDFLTGTDPVFAGLHSFEAMSYGRSYRTTAHVSHRHHSADRSTTIVLPTVETPEVIVHELGHALDEVLAFAHEAAPVTCYAGAGGRIEAFAEAFTSWLIPGYPVIARLDPASRALFEALA